MSISGYELTLEGTALGALAGIEAIRVGGLELRFDEIATIESYKVGTATFTNGSDQVAGVGTAWTSDMVGHPIELDADAVLHEVASVEDVDALTLTANYSDTGGSGAYTIFPSRVVENLPLSVREGPIEIDFAYTAAVYDTLSDAVLAQTEDTFTLSDSEGSTHIGLGHVATCGGKTLGSDGHSKFTVTLMPTTCWEFTPAA